MRLEEYRKKPCQYASLPYWKMKNFILPKNISVFHQSVFIDHKYQKIEKYFRLIHDLKNVENNDFNIKSIEEKDWNNLIDMINKCYQSQNISINQETLKEYTNRKVYYPQLWICIYLDDIMIASGIAEYDLEAKEGILEWIQVIPEYQRLGYGGIIVNHLLKRLKTLNADFVTVSGNIDNVHAPVNLYRRCGFTGNDIWYICSY